MSYLVYDPLDGDHQEQPTLKEAQKCAKEMIEGILDCCGGWPQEMECDGVKIFKLVEQSVKTDVKECEPGSEHDYMCNYKMESAPTQPRSREREGEV